MKILSSIWCHLDTITYYLSLYWVDNSVNTPPLVTILGLSPDDAKALQDIYDIINPPPLHAQLACALIKQ